MKNKILILLMLMCNVILFAQQNQKKDTISSFKPSLNTLSLYKGFEKVNSPFTKLSNFKEKGFFIYNNEPLIRRSKNSPLSTDQFSFVVYKSVSRSKNSTGSVEPKKD